MRAVQIIVVLVSWFVQVLIAFFPSISSSALGLPPQPTGKQLVEYQISTISMHFALMTVAIGTVLILESFKATSFQDGISHLLSVIQVKKLSSEEFYADFLHAAGKACHNVNISYLAPDPPKSTDVDFKRKYYKDLQALLVKKKKVPFRRIVRRTKANYPWVAQLLSELQGKPNASIALIDEADNTANPAALSVQVVDTSHVWFVAVKDHDQFGDWRDIFIESQKLAEAMNIYYERLWHRSEKLLLSGTLTPPGRDFTKAHPIPPPPVRNKGKFL